MNAARIYSGQAVQVALNRAADDVLEAIDAPDEGKRDVANLVVNAAMHYLDKPEASLADAIVAEYGVEDAVQVLEWCGA